MTPKQSKFVEQYLIDLNATQAAIRAGYSAKTATIIGFENLTKPNIAKAIAARRYELSAATEVTQERIVKEMARIGFFDVRRLLDADGKPIPLHLLSDEAAAVISGVEICTVGNAEMGVGEVVKLKLADKTKNLENLMRHMGGFDKDNAQKKTELVITGFRMVAS